MCLKNDFIEIWKRSWNNEIGLWCVYFLVGWLNKHSHDKGNTQILDRWTRSYLEAFNSIGQHSMESKFEGSDEKIVLNQCCCFCLRKFSRNSKIFDKLSSFSNVFERLSVNFQFIFPNELVFIAVKFICKNLYNIAFLSNELIVGTHQILHALAINCWNSCWKWKKIKSTEYKLKLLLCCKRWFKEDIYYSNVQPWKCTPQIRTFILQFDYIPFVASKFMHHLWLSVIKCYIHLFLTHRHTHTTLQ